MSVRRNDTFHVHYFTVHMDILGALNKSSYRDISLVVENDRFVPSPRFLVGAMSSSDTVISDPSAWEERRRRIPALWFWFLTNSKEKDIVKVLQENDNLKNICISYDCSCGEEECVSKTEYCRLQREEDIVDLFQMVASGTCVDASAETPENTDSIIQEIKSFTKREVTSLMYPRKRTTVGIYSAHVFVALDFKTAFHNSAMTFSPFKNSTFKLGLRPYDLMLEYKRYRILDSALYKNDVFMGRVSRSSFLDFTGYSTLIACEKALERNDTRACELLAPALNKFNNPSIWNEKARSLLSKVLQYEADECFDFLLPYLKKQIFCTSEKKNIRELVQRSFGNKKVFQSLLKHEIFSVSMCLSIAVKEDNVDIVQLIKDKFFLHEQKSGVPLLIQATFNDSHDMLRVLLGDPPCRLKSEWCGGKNTLVYTYCGYSVVRLARALGFTRCLQVLTNAGIPSDPDNAQSFSVVNVVFDLTSNKYSSTELVKRLAKSGYGVNTCIEVGSAKFPPIYDAIAKSELDMIKALLAAGATLFGAKDVTVLGCPPRLLAEFINHNTDICTENGSVLNNILEVRNSNREKLLHLVLNCAHTVPRKDREKLEELSKDATFYGCQKINEFLTSPRRLTLLSRDALRRHYGHLIHDYLETQYLPSVVVDFLKCKEALKPFLDRPLEFSKACEPLANESFKCNFPDNF